MSCWRVYDTGDGLAESGCISVTVGRHKVWVEGIKTGSVSGLDGYNITINPAPARSTAASMKVPVRSYGRRARMDCRNSGTTNGCAIPSGNSRRFSHTNLHRPRTRFRSAQPGAGPRDFFAAGRLDATGRGKPGSPKVSILRPADGGTSWEHSSDMTVTPPGGVTLDFRRAWPGAPRPGRAVNAGHQMGGIPAPGGTASRIARAGARMRMAASPPNGRSGQRQRKLIVRFDGQRKLEDLFRRE